MGYTDNPDKTNFYEYVKSYGCDYYTAANEFALSKKIYEQQTGRSGRAGAYRQETHSLSLRFQRGQHGLLQQVPKPDALYKNRAADFGFPVH